MTLLMDGPFRNPDVVEPALPSRLSPFEGCHVLSFNLHGCCYFRRKVRTLWQYGLWSFQTGGTKLERFLPKNQHHHRKLLRIGLVGASEVFKNQSFKNFHPPIPLYDE